MVASAPHVRLPAQDVLETPEELGGRIGTHVKHALMRQLYKLVLNIDTLGHPVNLVKSLGAQFKVRALPGDPPRHIFGADGI